MKSFFYSLKELICKSALTKTLTIVIIAGIVAAIVIPVAVNANKKEASPITQSESETKSKDKDSTSYIIKGTLTDDGTKQVIVAADATYEIENGVLYKLDENGKRVKLTDDLKNVTLYDEKDTALALVDGKFTKAEEETTNPAQQYAAGDTAIADTNNENAGGEATYEEASGDTTGGGGENTEWIYWYPTESGVYMLKDYPQLMPNRHDQDCQYLTAEENALLTDLCYKCLTGEVSEAYVDQVSTEIYNKYPETKGHYLWPGISVAHQLTNAQEFIATHGYAFLDSPTQSSIDHINYAIVYDAGRDIAYYADC